MARKCSSSDQFLCRHDLNRFSIVMAATVFLVLVIFMTSQPMIQYGVSVNLPRLNNLSTMPRADRDDSIVVALTRDGKVYLGSDPVDTHTLPGLICNRVAASAERKVYLKIDRNVKYGRVSSVLAAVRATGIEDIAFLAKKRYVAPAAPPQ